MKAALVVVAMLSGCAEPPESISTQESLTCGTPKVLCYPAESPLHYCDFACGTDAECVPYSQSDYTWCAIVNDPNYCDGGWPKWPTECRRGATPIVDETERTSDSDLGDDPPNACATGGGPKACPVDPFNPGFGDMICHFNCQADSYCAWCFWYPGLGSKGKWSTDGTPGGALACAQVGPPPAGDESTRGWCAPGQIQ